MDILFLCIKIFLVRIIDVSLGTARTIIMVKGKSLVASLIGFVEVFVWFVIAREALNTTESSLYSLGFATGTYIGSIFSNKYIEGIFGIEVITESKKLAKVLRDNNYAVSSLKVEGQNDKEKFMLLIEIKSKDLGHIKKLIEKNDKQAFIMVNETRIVQNGYFK